MRPLAVNVPNRNPLSNNFLLAIGALEPLTTAPLQSSTHNHFEKITPLAGVSSSATSAATSYQLPATAVTNTAGDTPGTTEQMRDVAAATKIITEVRLRHESRDKYVIHVSKTAFKKMIF